jgi:uncharacterized membrane protein
MANQQPVVVVVPNQQPHNFFGTASGAGIGAALGTLVFPVIGTGLGAVIGGGLGYIMRDQPLAMSQQASQPGIVVQTPTASEQK